MNCEHYLVTNNAIEAYGLSVTGQVRKANEDSLGFATVPNGELFVVCDGMGGHVGGATASKIAVEQIIEYLKAQQFPNVYQALNDALCHANRMILDTAAANPSLKGMGTTACIVLVSGNNAYIAHVGDSRIYLYEEQKKRLFRITKDHSLVQALVDQGQLDDRLAEHHHQKNVIMKALGTKDVVVPEVYGSPVQPAEGDMFLICSDGLSGMIDDNVIEAILSSDHSTEQKTIDLVSNANLPGKGLDNITAQLIKVLESPYPISNHPDHNPKWRNEPQAYQERAYIMEGNAEVEAPNTCAFVPEDNKKRMSPKWIALIVVGVLLVVCGGRIAYHNFRTWNNPQWLMEEKDRIENDTVKLDSIIKCYETAGLSHDDEDQELEELQNRLNKVQSKLNTIQNQNQKVKGTSNSEQNKSINPESNDSWLKRLVQKIKNVFSSNKTTRGESTNPSKANPSSNDSNNQMQV